MCNFIVDAKQGIYQSTVAPSTLPAGTLLVEFESEQQFKDKVLVQAFCESAISGVYVFVGNDGKRYLVANDHYITIPKKTHLGGLGGGENKSNDGLVDPTLAYSFSLGDQNLIELEGEENNSPSHCQRCVQHNPEA